MRDSFYPNQLYPLQDEVLQVVARCDQSFYLTGGTVLSRVYFQHRYSDDLDFFVNRTDHFQEAVNNIVRELKNNFDHLEPGIADENFIRFNITHRQIVLKCEFINDVAFRSGEVWSSSIFPRTDNWMNILSNKISALSRNEEKDVADILYICHRYPFNWQTVIEEARQKDLWVNELDISKHFFDFDFSRLEKIKWMSEQNYAMLDKIRQQISRDTLRGLDNVPSNPAA